MQEKVINGPLIFNEKYLIFYVNGKKVIDEKVDLRTTLATYLRDHCKIVSIDSDKQNVF